MTIKQIGFLIAAMLVLALFEMPQGYYNFLRFCVTGLSAYFFVEEYKSTGGRFELLVLLFGVMAILFNPILPFKFEKETWHVIDIAGAITLFAYARQK